MASLADFSRFLPSEWTVSSLSSRGYDGWRLFSELATASTPRQGGVYVVARMSADGPSFLDQSPAGWFKGKDPTVTSARLRTEWIADAQIIYIGKADDLADRLDLFRRFGRGEPVMHWGGRLIWQLQGADELRVGWLTTPDHDPEDVEFVQLEHFRELHDGRLPFANLRRGRLPTWFENHRRVITDRADRDARFAALQQAIDLTPPELMASYLAEVDEWRGL